MRQVKSSNNKVVQGLFANNLRNVAVAKNRRNVIFAIITVLLLAGLIWFYWGKSRVKKDDLSNIAVTVTLATVGIQDMPNKIDLVGTVYAFETVTIKSRIDSQITAVAFKDGDAVTEGQLLFQLDNSLLLAQSNQNAANLKRDEAQLENAKAQYERYRKLSQRGFASSEKLDEAAASYKTALAAVNATKASFQSIKTQLDFTTINAPISGRAGTIKVTRGNTVKANDTQSLVTINRVQPILVQFAIPQRYYNNLRQASKDEVIVTAKQAGDDQIISEGKLEYIENNIDSSTGSFNARAAFTNKDEKLWPGMFVNISIILNIDKAALVIPQVAVQTSQNGSFVFVADPLSKTATKRNVVVARTEGDKAIIKSGLSEGEQVVVDGLMKLSDGAKIMESQ